MHTDREAFGVRSVPHSTAHVEKYHLATNGFELLPRHILGQSHVNTHLQKFLPEYLEHLASHQYLLDNSGVVVPQGQGHPDQKDILVPGSWGRGVPIEYGVIPDIVHGYMWGTVMIKGGSLSGRRVYPGNRPTDNTTPWGFFGAEDAKKEIDICNTLLDAGFRISPPLGYVELDNKQLSEFLKKRWEHVDDAVSQQIMKSLHVVHSNNDIPVVMFRLTGTTVRIDQMDSKDLRAKARIKGEMARGARLLAAEAAFSQFTEYHTKRPPDVIQQSLEVFGRRQTPSWEDIVNYVDVLTGIIARNVRALKSMADHPSKKWEAWLLASNFASQAALGKDLNMMTFDYQDVEMVHKVPSKSPSYMPDSYMYAASLIAHGFLEEAFLPVWVPEDLRDRFLTYINPPDSDVSGHSSLTHLILKKVDLGRG